MLADDAVAGDDHVRAVDLAQRLLEVDRFDSLAHRRLIEALAGCGRHGEAQRASDRYRERMGELSGVVGR